MKVKGILFLFFLFPLTGALAQKNDKFVPYSELGVFAGVAYYNGELNPLVQFPPAFLKPAFGLVYRRNVSKRYALRASGTWGTVYAADRLSTNPLQRVRNLEFRSRVIELAGEIEFNFLPYEVGHKKFISTPYVFLGLAGFYFNPRASMGGNWYNLADQQTERRNYGPIQASIPFGMGFKSSVGKRFSLSLEWGLRKTFTDYLDDVSTVYPDSAALIASQAQPASFAGRQRGNSQNKDWYSFAGIIVSFTLFDRDKLCPAYQEKRKFNKFLEDKVF